MQKSTIAKNVKVTPAQRVKDALGQTSFIVTLCATLALVLGAISVGAATYITREPAKVAVSQPTPTPHPDTNTQRAASQPASPETAPSSSVPPKPITPSEPTIAQPADHYVPSKPGLVSLKLNTDTVHVEATIRKPFSPDKTLTTITIPKDGKPTISVPDLRMPNSLELKTLP